MKTNNRLMGNQKGISPRCHVCGERPAPFGFHKKFYCRVHRPDGETALPENDSGPIGPAQGVLV